ncbi:MAG TPA: S8 family serine peptidase [Pyrinomonadaceae bacterium]|nr:S8 family serine peptidase [Pyrinomonadaceae bacterium]
MTKRQTDPGKEDEPTISNSVDNAIKHQREEVDDFADRFDPKSRHGAWWQPGLIELVFKDPTQSGVRGWNFKTEKERFEFSEEWPDAVRNLLLAQGLKSWKPSFPLRYSWTKKSDDDAFDDYARAGHDRFVTLSFRKDAETPQFADELRELPEIEQAVAVPKIGPPSGPLDEPLMGVDDHPQSTICDAGGCLESQWYIFRCKVNQAWLKTNESGEGLSGRGVVIADVDWGFNPSHRDLIAQIRKTQNVFPESNSANETIVTNGSRCHHGTAALGLAGAQLNGFGIVGVAFGATLWAIQSGTDTREDHSLWVAGIRFVRDQQSESRKVIILEIQTKRRRNIEMIPTIADEIKHAISENIVVCVPAGNAGRDAKFDDNDTEILQTGSILVGATRFDATRKDFRGFSNYGDRVTVYAPGDLDSDLTCGPSDHAYRNGFGGTSSAVAKVAGVVALMLETNPALTHERVRDILGRSQIPVFDDSSTQIGVLLDAEQAVCEASQLAGRPC